MFSRNIVVPSTKVMSTCQRSLHLSYRRFLNPSALIFGQKWQYAIFRSSFLNAWSAILRHLASARRDIAIINVNQPDFVMANKTLAGKLK